MKIKYSRGFTLIELLIVVAILGILATAVIIVINPAQRVASAKDASVKSDITVIARALEAYNTSQGTAQYSSTLDDLVTVSELKSVPKQQSGNKACPAAVVGSTLSESGTAGTSEYYYCYYKAPQSGSVTSVAVMGSLFNVASDTWQCWDSNSGSYKSRTSAPTVASSILSC